MDLFPNRFHEESGGMSTTTPIWALPSEEHRPPPEFESHTARGATWDTRMTSSCVPRQRVQNQVVLAPPRLADLADLLVTAGGSTRLQKSRFSNALWFSLQVGE